MNLANFTSAIHNEGFVLLPTNCKNYGIRAKKLDNSEKAVFEVAVILKEFDVENDVVVGRCEEAQFEKKLKDAIDLVFLLNDFATT